MKKIYGLLALTLLGCQLSLTAQVALNTDGSLPDASAMLDIRSSTKGLLIPRVTTALRTAFTSPADGLLVYDTDTKGFWYYQGGSGWQPVSSGSGSGSLTLPFAGTASSASTLFSITNQGKSITIKAANTNADDTANVIDATTISGGVIANRSVGTAGNFFKNNTNGVGAALRGEVNSIFGNVGTAGVHGVASGTGGYGGYFEHTESTGFGYALYATTRGLGSTAYITSDNDNTTANTLNVISNVQGVIADHSQGNTGNFVNTNTNGVAAGVRGEVNSIFGNAGTAGIYGVATGTGGYGGYFDHTNTTGFGYALYATTSGLGSTAYITSNNDNTTANTLNVISNVQGVIADHSQGNTANFVNTNTNGVAAGVRGEVNSIFGNAGTAGIYGVATGTGGYGGYFDHTAATGYGYSLYATTSGLGSTAYITSDNDGSTANTLNVISNVPGVIADHSQGNTGNFVNTNTNGVAAGVRGEVNSIFGNAGTAGIYGVATGTGGYGGYFDHTSTTGYGNSLYATTSGLGSTAYITSDNDASTANTLNVISNVPGVIADHSQGNTGNFVNTNTNGVAAGVRGEVNSIFGNNGTAGVYGVASGTGGYGGFFEHTETTGYGIALQVLSNDKGPAMAVDHNGTGDLAVFQAGGSDVARIDHTGRGFFNGGTQNSGADLAEAFEVEGSFSEYEPGDVLLISTVADRTVTRSNEAYSTLVAGVYATKPGVLLTEDSLGAVVIGKVPMGVVGVIPTKVCQEGGTIHRGDILVTSSRQGYAMKADLNRLKPGQAIGKALENFEDETGKIKVLVNVK